MSPVFLSNVDDYLAPSQACVNPLFSEGVNKNNNDEKQEAASVGVIPRKRKAVRRRPGAGIPIPATPQPEDPAKVSMADCLACSGCVTSAETVLVEQHSLRTLKEKLSVESKKKVVVTISPASLADIHRHLGLDGTVNKRKLARFLHQACRASIVLDGAVPLQWSLQEAAREFCHAHDQNKNGDRMELLPPLPSIALSSTQSQQQDGTIVTHNAQRSESQLPLLAASCPALVCLVEKSHGDTLVPHLATTKSSMSMAGSYFSSCLHIGIMPCHDKKLEASRRDFATSDEVPDVDLVLTTSEWVEWIAETSGTTNVAEMKQYIESLEPVVSVTSLNCIMGDEAVVLVEPEVADDVVQGSVDTVFFEHASGGYADYIFRYAAKHLYGYDIPKGHPLPWKPVTTSKRVSARAATSSRNYYAVSLYQSGTSCSLEPEEASIPVLRFATAYGVQTLQRVFTSMAQYDYVEAMACPSGCLNGGGQNRLVERETPAQTRERVADTKRRAQSVNVVNTDVYVSQCPSGPFGVEAQRKLHTRYHVVPPLQHTLGAAAGVAVQDTQW